jgi:hypothetical protein
MKKNKLENVYRNLDKKGRQGREEDTGDKGRI